MRGRVDPAARHTPTPLNAVLPEAQLAAGPRTKRRRGTGGAALGAILVLILIAAATYAFAQPVEARLGGEQVRVVPFVTGLDTPWSIAFLPDGRLLVTERDGRLRPIDATGKVGAPISGVPKVAARGQGGLLDVALDPKFAQNRLIYLSYAEPRPEGAATAVARGKLSDDLTRLTDLDVIFRQQPAVSGGNHFGSRLVFAPDGMLFVTLGERFNHMDKAQDLSTTLGKVVRIAPDGSIPADNPFVERVGARPEIWSFGHRNVQAAAIEPGTGALWTVEHGPRGGDEVNRPEAGENYGWPVIGYGRHYSGAQIGVGTAKEGMEQPLFYWDPSIAPSGAAFYTGDALPGWRGQLFVGALAGQALVMVKVRDGAVIGEERLPLGKRIRDVRMGPDGALWLAAESTGEILRVVPAGR
ncbi:glucose/arabinose dehydrogenase [Xanthobacter flavus]|uniref:Dehydrogenase n=1 Tax=Xanthobacter flavus TaxID=281 RepID=A0A9W6FNZ5_XANFL|nr:PQQ-dependent sugar dehydrogenase [Xanthobacter flavus]MDR6336657.1 glucose/arabinose dehydrogenase [Xanthobacter flavus]GLI24483.1 dehydrogenase [Xanthobacter flavus]